ncbi:hypothetical protein [Streptomyces nigrescens]
MSRSTDGSARLWGIDADRAAADICARSRSNHWRDLRPELQEGSICG